MNEIKVPFSRSLTVLMTKDIPAVQKQADDDITAIEGGGQIFTHPTNEAYFHRLRRRVAERPELADKIVVFYLDENGKIHEIKFQFKDELKWPVGFCNELFDEELAISQPRRDAREKAQKEGHPFGDSY